MEAWLRLVVGEFCPGGSDFNNSQVNLTLLGTQNTRLRSTFMI